jgi:hypothetical protein
LVEESAKTIGKRRIMAKRNNYSFKKYEKELKRKKKKKDKLERRQGKKDKADEVDKQEFDAKNRGAD